VDAGAGAEGGAVEGGGGASEIELAGQGPALQEGVDEGGVEDVSGAGSVDGIDAEGGGVVELRSVPGEDTFFAKCCGSEARAKAFLEGGQRVFQVGFLHEATGDVSAGDEIVDGLQECFHSRVKIIHIGDDGNFGSAGPARRCGGSDSIVSIDVKSAGVDDPVLLEFFGAQGEAIVTFPENGAFAGVVDEDESLLAGAAGGGEEVGFDAGTSKFGAMEYGGVVVTDFADVARAQTPLLAGDHGGGDLAAGQDLRGAKFDFGAAGGIVCDGNESVGGVEADADDVEHRGVRHDGPGHCKGSKRVFKGGRKISIEAGGAPEG